MSAERDAEPGAQPRPAWVSEPAKARPRDPYADPDLLGEAERPAARMPVRAPAASDGLWVHVTEVSGIVALLTWILAVALPPSVHLWMFYLTGAALTCVTGWVTASLTQYAPMAGYLALWVAVLTGWITAARWAGPWHGVVIFALILPCALMTLAGVAVIRGHRSVAQRAVTLGRDTANARECQHWEGLLPRMGVTGVAILDVIHVVGGYQVHCRLGRVTEGRRRPSTMQHVRELAGLIEQHKRTGRGSVYIEEEPENGNAADFVIHVRTEKGPRLARYLPAENKQLSINRPFGLGVLDTGKEWTLRLREVVVFIAGLRGSGKSTLLNVFTAQLARMPDALIFMIDLKGGQEARAWLMPWLRGWAEQPVIHWLATTRQEADVMLDALKRAGTARAESGRYGKKLRPRPDAPAIIVICDETVVMTGHSIYEDNLSNNRLAVKLVQIAETYRSVAIDPVVAAVRAVVDATGNSGLKAQSDVRIGMRAATFDEARQIFSDDPGAARQLSQLKDRGMFIPKVGPDLYPPVHGYNITDGDPDDDGHPTEDRITPIAIFGGQRENSAKLEDFVAAAMGDDYGNRWDQPHLKQLLETWRQEEGDIPSPPPEEPEQLEQPDAHPGGKLSEQEQALFAQIALMEDPDADGPKLHPARKQMREALMAAGPFGLQVKQIQLRISNQVVRQTVHAWLEQDEKLGYVRRTGKIGDRTSRWVWQLKPGDEFDIPGMG